jgi:hypothetical protein
MTGEATRDNMRIVNGFIEPLIAEALRRKKLSAMSGEVVGDTGEGYTNLLDHLISVTDGMLAESYVKAF